MKLAIMQPYFFPYIGYFQLINMVNKFVVYDDVTFIKQGWINRNKILISGQNHYFTVPLIAVSSNKLIKDIQIVNKFDWKRKLMKTIQQAYRKAPFFTEIFSLIREILLEDEMYISRLAFVSLVKVSKYLNIDTQFVETSTIYNNSHLKSQERILDICKIESATNYINSIGGINLYQKKLFEEHNLKLNFIKTSWLEYKQFNNDFLPWLSIIDVLMFNSKDKIHEIFLKKYELT